MEKIVSKKILAIIGVACLVIGIFLPYFKIEFWIFSESISLWRYWEGKIILILAVLNLLFIFKDWIIQKVPQMFNNNLGKIIEKANNLKLSLIPTILVAAFLIYMFFKVDVDFNLIKYGAGFWILWIGVIFLIAHAIFYKVKTPQMDPNKQETKVNKSF